MEKSQKTNLETTSDIDQKKRSLFLTLGRPYNTFEWESRKTG